MLWLGIPVAIGSVMTNNNIKTPFFKEMSDEALRTEYAGWRNLAYNNANIAACGSRSRAAGQMGRIMRNVEIIEAIARKRGICLV